MPRGHVAIDPAGQRRLLLSPEWMEEGRLGSQANAVLGDKRRSARSNLGAGWAGPSREIFLRTKKRDAARSARRRRAGTQAWGGGCRGWGRLPERGAARDWVSEAACDVQRRCRDATCDSIGMLCCQDLHPRGHAEPWGPRGRLGVRGGWDRGAHARSPV